MNYFALGSAILAGLIALHSLSLIVRAATGLARWSDSWGFTINAITVALFGTLAVWLFGMVAS